MTEKAKKARIFNEIQLEDILRLGVVIVGLPDCGKTNLAKILAYELKEDQKFSKQLKIFDTCLNWQFKFDSVLFQEINHKTRLIYNGLQHVLYNVNIKDAQKVMQIIGKIALNDYDKQYQLKTMQKGNVDHWKVYIIEEAQNILSTYALSSKSGKLWLKLVSEGRNFGLSFVFIGQRLADISTQAIERKNAYFFGKMLGDNDLAKIKRICGSKSKIDYDVSRLDDKGEFVYYNGVSAYRLKTHEFKPKGEAFEWQPKIKPKKWWNF